MSPAEAAVVKSALKVVVDQELPALISAEEARLPAAYQPLVGAVVSALFPKLQALLDAKIDAIGGAAPAAAVASS